MKQEWIVRRRIMDRKDGQRRWDLAYQCLLSWSQPTRPATAANQTSQEGADESSHLCPGLQPQTEPQPDH